MQIFVLMHEQAMGGDAFKGAFTSYEDAADYLIELMQNEYPEEWKEEVTNYDNEDDLINDIRIGIDTFYQIFTINEEIVY